LRRLPVKPLDRAVVHQAVVAVVQHGNDDMLVDPDVERGAGLYDLEGDGFVLARWSDVSAGMVVLWNRMVAEALARMAVLTMSRGQAGADEIVPVETMFRPIILFFQSSKITPSCARSDCPQRSMSLRSTARA
jgi:hypothetical protein